MLTHRVDSHSFDFMAMMHEALDLDFSKVRPALVFCVCFCMQQPC